MKLLIGGSPCTHWSIAQTKNRETEPSGIGWELFENYLIALDRFQSDYFLYENNKSMSSAIREEITRRLGVEPICINSALVSAQNRQRLYWTNIPSVKQPEDWGILLQDILESGVSTREKAYTLLTTHRSATADEAFRKKVRNIAAEPVNVTADGKARCLRATYYKDGIRNMVGNDVDRKTCVAESFQEANYEVIDGTSVFISNGKIRQGDDLGSKQGKYVYLPTCEKSNTIGSGQAHNEKVLQKVEPEETYRTVYEVRNGFITIKGKQYPIKLTDGCYIIRKLTVRECMRLQTVPEWYEFPVSDTQAYKMLGNGWTVDVIAHILSYCPGITTEPLDVLSMYDGMACGHLALDKLGAHIQRYRATEIDKYAIKTACYNFSDIEQLGDAFQVRDWR